MTIKCNLKELLEKNDITRYKLKKDTGLSQTTIDKLYENLAIQYDKRVLEKICIYLNCDLNDILTLEN